MQITRWIRRANQDDLEQKSIRSEFSWNLLSSKQTFILIIIITLLGLYIRLTPVLSTDFPLNDGGFFYSLIQDLKNTGFMPPSVTSYNHANIPFAYPPLSFYLVALLGNWSQIPTLDLIRLLPGLTSVLIVPVMYLFAAFFAEVALPSVNPRVYGLITATVIAFWPATYSLFIEGGGIARAPGYVAAVLACYCAFRLWRQSSLFWLIASIAALSLTILFHPGAAWFALTSILFSWLWFGRSWRTWRLALFLLLGTVLATSPWWWGVLTRYGIDPLIAASQTPRAWSAWESVILWNWSTETFLPLFAFLGLLGIFWCVNHGLWFLPAWLVIMLLVNGRSVPAFAAPAMSLLISIAVIKVIVPPLGSLGARIALLWGLVFVFVAAWAFPFFNYPMLRTLDRGERAALDWIKLNTPATSRFAVITADPLGHDPVVEWFPALTMRVSINTTQGYEWIRGAEAKRIMLYPLLQQCDSVECVEAWSKQAGQPFTHLYLSANCCVTLRYSLQTQSEYVINYSNASATIFVRSSPIRETEH